MSNHISNNKKIAKNTALLYLRSLFLLFINLYTSRLTLQVLGVDDYGIYHLVGGVVGMFTMLSETLSAASQRFITYALGENKKEELKKVFSNSITLHLVLGVIIVILLESLGLWLVNSQLNIPNERLQMARIVMHFSVAAFFVNVIAVPFNAVIIAHEKMTAFAVISIIEGLLKLAIVIILPFLTWDKLLLYSLLTFLVALVIRFLYSIYSKRHFEETQSLKLGIDSALFKEMFNFAGWNLFGQGSMVLRNQGIDILLNIFFGVAVNAAKGVSNQVQHAVHAFVGNFTTSIKPQLIKSVAQRDYKRTHSLTYHGARLSFFMMMIFVVPLIVCANEVMNIWLVNVPCYAVSMVQIALLYLQSNTLSRFLIISILAHGNIRNFQIFAGGTKLLAFPIAWVVLKLGGSPMTGIWVNIALDFVCRGEELYFINKKNGYDYKHHLIKADAVCWFTFIVSLVLAQLMYKYISSKIFIAFPISFVIVLLTIWFIGMDKKEKSIINNWVVKFAYHK